MPIPLRRWLRPAAPLALSLFALTACTSPEPTPPATTSATDPVFANEEEALAAVTATFERYHELSFRILAEGGADPQRISEVTSEEVAAIELDGYDRAANSGWLFSGTPVIRSANLEFWYRHPDSLSIVARADLCVDISGVSVTDGLGQSVVDPARPNLALWSVDFSLREIDNALIVSAKDMKEAECP